MMSFKKIKKKATKRKIKRKIKSILFITLNNFIKRSFRQYKIS